jgi:hypothetical protein
MKKILVRKKPLHDASSRDDLKDLSPGELMGMVWRLRAYPKTRDKEVKVA